MNIKRYSWKTSEIIWETNDAITIIFDTIGEGFDFLPGQFINLSLEIDGEIISRSYSLCSVPGQREKPAITIKQVPGGRVSGYLVKNAGLIRQWRIEGPFGSFVLPAKLATGQHVVFIAGGSGITPLFSMINYLLLHTGSFIMLLYANKTPDDTIYFDSLNRLQQQYSGRFRMQYIFSRISDYALLQEIAFLKARLNPIVLKDLLLSGQAIENNSLFYLCGPEGLIQMSNEALLTFGIPRHNIRMEYFSPPSNIKPVTLPEKVLEVQLHFYEQTNLLEVEPGKTILDAALIDHIKVPYSCKNGTCGVCVGKVTEGNVYMHTNYSLTNEAVKSGYILLCQSHPFDGEVTIEIG